MSNPIVMRIVRRCALLACIFASGVLIAAVLASQIGQHIFRTRVERLFAQAQSLEIGKTSRQDAELRLHGWQAEKDSLCSETECTENITLTEPVSGLLFRQGGEIFVRLDDYIRWRLRLHYSQGPFARIDQFILLPGYMLMGGRPARVMVSITARDGVVWNQDSSVEIETYWHKIPGFNPDGWFEYTLIGSTHRVRRIDFTRDPKQLALHPQYVILRPGGCEICIDGYVYITSEADPADLRRLTQFNLSCLTRIRPCVDENDLMPAAWKQYLDEHPWDR